MNPVPRPIVKRRPLVAEDLDRMQLPREYWELRIQGSPESARPLVISYLRSLNARIPAGVGLLLSGPAGTGKTALAAIVAKEARIQGYSVLFIPVWDLREAVRVKAPFDADSSVIERARIVDLLVLDNLRMEDREDPFFGRRPLEELIVGRAANGRASVVTTQASFADFDHPKTGWRSLPPAGKLVLVPVTGPDLRAQAHRDLTRSLREGDQ